MITRLKLVLSFAIVLATTAAHADPMVYVTNLFQQFGTLNLANGQFQAIGPGLPEGGAGLVPGSNGSLLTLSVFGNLDAIDPATGLSTVVGPTGLGENANSLAAVNGTLYATDLANNLYSINSVTGAATLIGATGIPPVPAFPFTTNPDGTTNLFDESLYGVGNKLYATFDAFQLGTDNYTTHIVVSPNLWQIDPITGAATLVASTDAQLLSSVFIDGTFYALRGTLSADSTFFNPLIQAVTLDRTTGKTSVISDTSAAGPIFGMSPVPAVPEPSTLALLGTGLLAGAARLRKR